MFQTSFDQQWSLRQLKEQIGALDFEDKEIGLKLQQLNKKLSLPDGNCLKDYEKIQSDLM